MDTTAIVKAAALLRPVENFPKPGIKFWDLQPILRDQSVVRGLAAHMAADWWHAKIDVVAAFDARGFIIGQALASELGVGMEMIRKAGKLPGRTRQVSYQLEYGSATLEMIDDGYLRGKRVLLVDDLLATGGTALAGVELVESMGGIVVGFSAITELPHLGGRGILKTIPVHSLISIVDGTAVVGAEYCVDLFVTDSSTKELLLIERLNHPIGLAMPGGHIEPGESVLGTARRELLEETGCEASEFEFLGVLAGLNRDPRGVKISVVVSCATQTKHARGETGKTRLKRIKRLEALPPDDAFALGHGPLVSSSLAEFRESEERRQLAMSLGRVN